ncbi:hypothetical protein TNCV_841461 [Trichonephila clavipes]|nr:hypothetical protein TNCV_841461 [Trichonephila clavipes]
MVVTLRYGRQTRGSSNYTSQKIRGQIPLESSIERSSQINGHDLCSHSLSHLTMVTGVPVISRIVEKNSLGAKSTYRTINLSSHSVVAFDSFFIDTLYGFGCSYS